MIRTNFNDGWIVSKDGSGAAMENFLRGDNNRSALITLPHDAMILEERNETNPAGTSNGFYPGGNYTYRKTFTIPEDYVGKRILLEFEGIYNRARVYLNDQFICSNAYGYTGFCADLTPYINYTGENLVTVNAINSDMPNSRWYTGSGIYRPVSMLVGDVVHIVPDGLRIATPEVAEDISLVQTAISIAYTGVQRKKVYINTELIDGSGNVVNSERTPVTLFENYAPLVRQRIYLRNAKLWSPEEPNLYQCKVQIIDGDKVLDTVASTFGVRHIQVDPLHGFRINGVSTPLRGSCIHHDNGVLGAVAFAAAEERRIRISKEAGFNAIRSAHNTASKALLDACDRIGMLVIDEAFDVWNFSKTKYDYAQDFSQNWEKDVEYMVTKDFNHPSVVMYSVGNEIPEVGAADGSRMNRMLAEKFRTLDSTRFVTNGINSLACLKDSLPQVISESFGIDSATQGAAADGGDINDMMTAMMGRMNDFAAHPMVNQKLEETYSALDLCGQNYMRSAYSIDSEKYPNRITYGSETLPPDIDLNWQCMKDIANNVGDFSWTGWDYIGEAGVGYTTYNGPLSFTAAYPACLANVGDIDITGERRPSSYFREIVYGRRTDPYITVECPEHYNDDIKCTPWGFPDSLNSWTWPGFEGKPCKTIVYSDADEIALFLNGNFLAKEKCNRFKAAFDITYQSGVLEAISYKDGKETGRYSLKTADDCLKINVDIDKQEIKSDGQDLVYIMVSLTDENGIVNTAAERKISTSVEGPAVLQGFGSANPVSTENYFDNEHTTYKGKVLAVIRATGAGVIKVKFSCDGCETKETSLIAK